MTFTSLKTALLFTTIAAGAAHAQPIPQPQQPTAPAPATGDAIGPAPDASASAPAPGDIVVTALKRNETALQTPASIAVLSNAGLASKNVVAANQLNGIVPALTMSVGVAGLPGTSFRGLGSNSAVFSLEPSVAEYQDGVYLGHARDYVSPLYDVDHVEFIKGTQSTLLGKNTSLGAISIVNKAPTHAFDYMLSYTHSFKIDGNRGEGAVNIPLGEKFQLRAAFLASRDYGYLDNVYKRGSEPRQDDLSGRLKLAYQASDDIDAILTYQHDYRKLRGQSLEVVSDPNRTIANRAAAVGVPFDTVASYISASAAAPLGGTVRGIEPYDRQDTNRLNLVVNAALGDFKLSLQSAYTQWNSNRATDLDFTAANLFNLNDSERSKTFTQEVRISSPTGGRFEYLVGAYYYHNNWNYTRNFAGSPANTVGFAFTGSALSSTSLPTRAVSAFASGSFELLRGLKLDGSLRYTHEKKRGNFVRVSSGTLAGAFPTTPFSVYPSQTTNPLDFNVGVRYQANASILLYGSYSKGSKSGGYQDAPTTVAGAPFAPETAYSAEVGAKLRLARGYITAALFNTRVRGFQTSYTAGLGTPPVVQTIVGNSNVRSRGFELQASQRLVPGLTVSGSVVYADAKFTDPFPASGAIGHKGDQLTRAPKWSGQAGVDYDHAMTDRLSLFGGATVNVTSLTRYQFVVAQPLAPTGAAHALLDGRIGVRGEGDRWQLAVIGTNLLNRHYIDFATSISQGNGAYYGSFNRPRVVALQLTLKH